MDFLPHLNVLFDFTYFFSFYVFFISHQYRSAKFFLKTSFFHFLSEEIVNSTFAPMDKYIYVRYKFHLSEKNRCRVKGFAG